ncbi:LGFP repeat-containing protein [Rhodococcus sp. SORGH_AS_0301]|uniref:LGFP repeat-containing protein n=1 Tax=Rhodococcus sp. SORGH_AS_0301 TaxID=3041780 RepID=UPI002783FEB4|nr:hypothetical protein [Rhodococcus sp. SORGH_AS_0301]MDQ1178558.1 hypothetical protein [Rhodococcus sp. SORGH_AS_0301]
MASDLEAVEENGPLRDKYNSVGGLTPGSSFLGYLTGDHIRTLPDGQGQMARFQNGVIYYSPTTGAHPVVGDILAIWAEDGYEASGGFGYPIASQVVNGNRTTQEFQGATLDVVSETFAVEIEVGKGPCIFSSAVDRVHRKQKPPTPFRAGAHVWYNPVSNCPPASEMRAVVSGQLQTLSPQGVWQNRGPLQVSPNHKPGSGGGNWFPVQELCNGTGPLTWRVIGDVDLIGAEDGLYTPVSYGWEIACS